MNKPEDMQAAYWQGNITRGEAQKVFDELAGRFDMIAAEFDTLRTMIYNVDFGVQCLASQLGITREDIRKFATEKLAGAKVPAGSNDAPV